MGKLKAAELYFLKSPGDGLQIALTVRLRAMRNYSYLVVFLDAFTGLTKFCTYCLSHIFNSLPTHTMMA